MSTPPVAWQEAINQLGSQFLNFAWPMLWQSSLLIAIVFTLDRLLAHKLRAAVRHALWLVVLVKLLLPPTLALPTGVAWWLGPTKSPAKPVAQAQITVTDSATTTLPTLNNPTAPVAPPPAPRLNFSGWTVVTAGIVSGALLLWLTISWIRITRLVQGASPANELSQALDVLQATAGLRGRVRMKIVDGQMSPAICGLFRPVILLPRSLAQKLSAGQLRAVLLHELIHLRRRDIWVNCAQALLQILYWWHPLVWAANARIRRVREESVDDAVMLALAPEAKIYAPTLLEVAKLAFRRPLISLGLIGIMESRSTLRGRIERLLVFQAPRHAGLTITSLVGIALFSAIALPMGAGPAGNGSLSSDTASERPAVVASGEHDYRQVLIQGQFYHLSDDQAKPILEPVRLNYQRYSNEWIAIASPEAYSKLETNLINSGYKPVQRPRIMTNNGMPAQFFVGNDSGGTDLDVHPNVWNDRIELSLGINITDRPANSTNLLNARAILLNHGGLVTRVPHDPNNTLVLLRAEILTNKPSTSRGQGSMTAPEHTGAAATGGQASQFHQRSFKVSTNVMFANLGRKQLLPTATSSDGSHPGIQTALRKIFTDAGVDLQSPPGKSVFYNERLGWVFVKAPEADLDIIESILSNFQGPAFQIHLKARFIAAPYGLKLTANKMDVAVPGGILTAILSPQQTKDVLRDLASRPGVETLGEPEVTLLNNRHVSMRATTVTNLITGMKLSTNQDGATTSDALEPQTSKVEFGPRYDATPHVFDDGYTVNLPVSLYDDEFEGYVMPPNDYPQQYATNSTGKQVLLPQIWPAIQAWSKSMTANLYDNQTLFLTLGQAEAHQALFADRDQKREAAVAKGIDAALKRKGNENILVLITATLVDATGSRIHSDAELEKLPKVAPQPN